MSKCICVGVVFGKRRTGRVVAVPSTGLSLLSSGTGEKKKKEKEKRKECAGKRRGIKERKGRGEVQG